MMPGQESYLLAKAAKSAWDEAKGDHDHAVGLLSVRLSDDADLREHIAVIAISEISFRELDLAIGPAEGSA